MRIEQIGSIFWFNFSLDKISRADQIQASGMAKFKMLHKILLENGIYLGPSGYEVGFISDAHTIETLENAATIICQALDKVFE